MRVIEKVDHDAEVVVEEAKRGEMGLAMLAPRNAT